MADLSRRHFLLGSSAFAITGCTMTTGRNAAPATGTPPECRAGGRDSTGTTSYSLFDQASDAVKAGHVPPTTAQIKEVLDFFKQNPYGPGGPNTTLERGTIDIINRQGEVVKAYVGLIKNDKGQYFISTRPPLPQTISDKRKIILPVADNALRTIKDKKASHINMTILAEADRRGKPVLVLPVVLDGCANRYTLVPAAEMTEWPPFINAIRQTATLSPEARHQTGKNGISPIFDMGRITDDQGTSPAFTKLTVQNEKGEDVEATMRVLHQHGHPDRATLFGAGFVRYGDGKVIVPTILEVARYHNVPMPK